MTTHTFKLPQCICACARVCTHARARAHTHTHIRVQIYGNSYLTQCLSHYLMPHSPWHYGDFPDKQMQT